MSIAMNVSTVPCTTYDYQVVVERDEASSILEYVNTVLYTYGLVADVSLTGGAECQDGLPYYLVYVRLPHSVIAVERSLRMWRGTLASMTSDLYLYRGVMVRFQICDPNFVEVRADLDAREAEYDA